MRKVMVDMDEVLCENGHLGMVNAFLDTNYTHKDLPGYFTEDLIPKERLDEYFTFFSQQNIYAYASVMKDAVEVLEKLSKQYEIFICTAYYNDTNRFNQSHILLHKYEWLQKQFPFISPSHYIFINDKTLLECDIKIDDKLSNLKGYGEVKLLFDSYHNQDISEETLKDDGIIRVFGWKDIENILLEG